jgi:hypothetical protein
MAQPEGRAELKEDGNESCSVNEPDPRKVVFDDGVARVGAELEGKLMTRTTAYMGVRFCFGCGFFFFGPKSSAL